MRRALIATSFALLIAPTVRAQSLSLAPHIGIYIPTENLYRLATGSTAGDDFQLEAGPSIGARLGIWFGPRFGIEASGSYVPTTFRLTQTSSGPVTQDAKLFVGSGQAVFYLIPRTSLLSVYLSGGVGVVSRGGFAFTDEAETSDLGGMVGAGAGIRLGILTLTAGVDLLTYTAHYQGAQVTAQELRQKDLNVKLGLGIPFGGGGRALARLSDRR